VPFRGLVRDRNAGDVAHRSLDLRAVRHRDFLSGQIDLAIVVTIALAKVHLHTGDVPNTPLVTNPAPIERTDTRGTHWLVGIDLQIYTIAFQLETSPQPQGQREDAAANNNQDNPNRRIRGHSSLLSLPS
jgi:hypothetical protein